LGHVQARALEARARFQFHLFREREMLDREHPGALLLIIRDQRPYPRPGDVAVLLEDTTDAELAMDPRTKPVLEHRIAGMRDQEEVDGGDPASSTTPGVVLLPAIRLVTVCDHDAI